MRWRIPLVLILALFVAVSCDQQPTHPLEPNADDVPAVVASQGRGADLWIDDLEFGFLLCDYTWVDCQMRVHDIARSGSDGSGAEHYTWHQTLHGTCSSEATGEEWRVTNDWHTMSNWLEAGQDEFVQHYISAGVGKGHAPNFKARIRCKWTINANGELVVDRCSEYRCEEFGN